MVGEVGEAHRATELMGEYTSGQRLHMAYSFEMLKSDFSAAHFKKQIVDFFTIAPDGWPCWAFSNHDVIRHATRWAAHGKADAVAKFAAGLLLSLEGSICLYQGEELGQTETELNYDELTDPQGIVFWPADKGRDGCRTPMVWDADEPHAGFSSAQPWLPVKPPQMARAVAAQLGDPNAVLACYQRLLGVRRDNADLRTGRTQFLCTSQDNDRGLMIMRRGDGVICVFNFGDAPAQVSTSEVNEMLYAHGATLGDGIIELAPLGFAWVRGAV